MLGTLSDTAAAAAAAAAAVVPHLACFHGSLSLPLRREADLVHRGRPSPADLSATPEVPDPRHKHLYQSRNM